MNFDYHWIPWKLENDRIVVADESVWNEIEKWNPGICIDCDCRVVQKDEETAGGVCFVGLFCPSCEKLIIKKKLRRPKVLVVPDPFVDYQGPIVDEDGNRLRDGIWHECDTTTSIAHWLNMSHLRQRLLSIPDQCQNIDFYLKTEYPENIERFWTCQCCNQPPKVDATMQHIAERLGQGCRAKVNRDPSCCWSRSNVYLIGSGLEQYSDLANVILEV